LENTVIFEYFAIRKINKLREWILSNFNSWTYSSKGRDIKEALRAIYERLKWSF